MEKIVRKTLLIAFVAIANSSLGQQKQLEYGNIVPDVNIPSLYNTSLKSIKLSDYKGKIIILDFWSSWCGSCIKGLERLNNLQDRFKNEIKIIPVNYQTKDFVKKFWMTNSSTKNLKLFTVTDDKRLTALFPHVALPFEVWIDKEGKYLGTTELEYANENEINSLLKGNQPRWLPISAKRNPDFKKSIISQPGEIQKSSYSLFVPFSPGFKEGIKISVDSIKRQVRITCINFTPFGLYGTTLQTTPEINSTKRMSINVKDTTKLRYYKTSGYHNVWDRINRVSYELQWPLDNGFTYSNALMKMRSDLNQFFKLNGRISTHLVKYLKLVRLKSTDSREISGRNISQQTIDGVILFLNTFQNLPIIESSLDIDKKQTIVFDFNANDNLDEINQKLKVNGFQLIPAEDLLSFFELTDE